MLFYTLRRINLLLITLLALTLVAYLLEYRLLDHELGFWSGYPDFLRRIVAGDFGLSSVSGLPVLDEIRLLLPGDPDPLSRGLCHLAAGGDPARDPGGPLIRGVALDLSIMAAGLIGYAVPVFWLALLMVMFFSLDLGWLPSSGQISLLYDVPSITGIALFDVLLSNEPWRQAALHDALRHLILPRWCWRWCPPPR